MKKILLSLFMMLSTLSIMAGVEAKPITFEEALDNGSVVTLCVGDKYLYGSGAQNCAMGTPAEVVAEKNAVVGFKLEKIEEGILFRAVTPAGGDYSLWGDNPCYLNSQPTGGVTFILGLAGKNGKDAENCAVWTAETDGSLKCVGNGFYFNGANMSAEPVAVSLVELVGEPDPEPEPDPVAFPESLSSLVENATIFTLKNGDLYLYGTEQQGIGAGDWAAACAETNNANGYILEKNEDGYVFFRAVKADGSNISAWGTTPCYLNAQPSASGVIFNMGKDQDFKHGSTWIISEVEGGYTIQNLGNKAYLSGNGLSETPAVWELYVPGEDLDLTISPAFVVEGEEDVVTLNDHSSVSAPSANALKVNFGDNAAVRYATYVINELVEDVDWSGEPYTYEEEVASGTLSINTIGYAEFAEPLTFYYGHKYNIIIKAWDVDENNLFDEDFNMAAPIGTFTAEFNGSTDETPAGEDIVVTPAFINGEEEVTLNDHASVSVEAANAIKVAFENAQPTEVNYVINEMVQSESEEGTSWVAGEEIAAGTLSMNVIGYAEFANPLTFVSGKKYQLTVSAIAQTEELGSYTYEFNGAYVAPEPVQAEIADGAYRIVNVEANLFLSNGAYWGTRAVLAENGISYNVVRNLENGKYTLKSGIKGDAKALRPSDGFNDQSGEWEIYQCNENGGVVLFNGEKYFSYDGTNIPQFVDEPTDASVWQFVSEDDIKAMVATATRENPMDATIYVKGADFLNGDVANAAWAGNKVGGDNTSGNTKINNSNCEAWNKGAFTISQTITDLPNGFYDLTAFGFYREGNRDVVSSVDAYENGTENASILSANDKSVALKSVYSEAKTEAEGGWAVQSAESSAGNVYFIPNSQGEAAACFEAGAYLNEIKNIEVTDGTLTISVSREGEAIFDWTVFDNIRLTYYGAPVAPVVEDCDLTKEMFFQYNSNVTGEALEEPATIGCDYNVGVSNGMIYGLSTVKWYAYADVTPYNKLILAVTEGTPRVMYNREIDPAKTPEDDGVNHVEITTESPYLTIEEIGDTKYYVYDLQAMAAANPAKPFVHINAIKGANWANATINDMKLFATAESAEEYLNSLVVLEPEIETTLIDGEDEITLNTHSSISVEKIDGIKVNFIDMPGVASATYAIMPMTLVQTEEGSSWTPDTENATTGEFSINTIGNADVDYTFNQGTKYQIVVKATLQDGTDVTETYEINGAAEPAGPEIAGESLKLMPGGNSNLPIPEDAVRVFTFNSQWSNTVPTVNSFDASIYKEIVIEFKEALPFYYNTPYRLEGVEGDAGQKWGGVAAGETEYRLDLTETGSITDFNIQNTQASETPGNTFAIANAYAVKQDGSVEPLFFQAPGWGGSMAVEADIYSANVTFNGQWANIGIDGLKGVEGKKIIRVYTNTPINPEDVQFCIKTTDGADAWPQIILQDETKCYGLAEISETLESILLQWKSTTPGSMDIVAITAEVIAEPAIAMADMQFNVAEGADIDEDGEFKVEFNYAATANEAAEASFPSGMIAYKVTDAEGNVVAENETDFDLSSTSRNIYLKNLEPGKTYTLTATKVYGAGFDMTTFETVEIPATFAGELPTITFTVPEAEDEKVTYEGYISMVADFVDPNTVSKTVAQQETIVVSKSEIEFSSVVLPDVNIATGSFTVPVTTSTGNDGETVYTADGVDVDLNTLYISGGQDEVVTYKAWLLGVDSANGPVIYLHLESVNQEIFIAYNSALDITEFILANVSDVDVKTGNVKALKTLEAVNINSVKNNGIANGKYLENGKVVIVRNGQKYTTNGSITK